MPGLEATVERDGRRARVVRPPVPEVSLVIPTRDEQQGIGECLAKARRVFVTHGINAEIIVADNSRDRTPAIAAAAGATVLTPDRLGYSYACAFAIRAARGTYIVLSDADGTYEAADIPRLLQPLRERAADLVIGSRFRGEIRRGAMPWLHRYVGNPFLSWILNLRFGTHVSDAHSGLRAFTREVWRRIDHRLLAEDFCSEMLRQMARQRARIVEIPIAYHPRKGRAKEGTLVHGWRCLRFVLWRVVLRPRE